MSKCGKAILSSWAVQRQEVSRLGFWVTVSPHLVQIRDLWN